MNVSLRSTLRPLAATAIVLPLLGLGALGRASAAAPAPAAATAATGLGPVSGLLPVAKQTVASAVRIDLNNQTARLPLHRGSYRGTTVWYILTDASEQGPADELGLNLAPKLGNAAAGCPACVQQVTLRPAKGQRLR